MGGTESGISVPIYYKYLIIISAYQNCCTHEATHRNISAL